jgi:uncharacterized protein
MGLICRENEVKTLTGILNSKKPEFCAIYGRRRVGKTYLIRSFFELKNCVFFTATGTKNCSYKTQLLHFSERISEVFYDGIRIIPAKNWEEAFLMLREAINRIDKKRKIVIFLDELPWMATKRSKLLETIDYYWNQYWSNEPRVKFFVCGSSASWIINKIVNNKGGLYNRVTETIHLKAFNLSEMERYLSSRNINLSRKQLVELYMVTGGVPFYLSKANKGESSTQLIESLAFNEKALLLNEFDLLFESLFDNSESYIEIVKFIAKQREGVAQEDLFKKLKKTPKGDTAIRRLQDLEDAGFIISFTPHFHKKRGIYYRIIDEYAFFYLAWLAPLKTSKMIRSLEKGYWKSVSQTPKWLSWAGYAFESVCYNHLIEIRKALDLSPTAIPNSWRYTPRSGKYSEGAQIDLLFDRDDDSITICEIKFTNKMFDITKDYSKSIKRKVSTFKQVTGTKKQLFIAMVSASGVRKNKYSEELISNVVILDDLFKARN